MNGRSTLDNRKLRAVNYYLVYGLFFESFPESFLGDQRRHSEMSPLTPSNVNSSLLFFSTE